MPGPIIPAGEVSSRYGGKKATKHGDLVELKNSAGKTIYVKSDQPVYHRGNGKFAPYQTSSDKNRKSRGGSKGDSVGTGKYRQTTDRTAERGSSKKTGSKPKKARKSSKTSKNSSNSTGFVGMLGM